MGITQKWWLAVLVMWVSVELWIYITIPSTVLNNMEMIKKIGRPMAVNTDSVRNVWDFLTNIAVYNGAFFNTQIGSWIQVLLIVCTIPVIIPVMFELFKLGKEILSSLRFY